MPGVPPSSEPQTITLSPTNPDPLASLQIWGVTVELGGRDFVVPALPASAWLQVLLVERPQPENWFPGFLDPGDQLALYEMLLDGSVGDDDFETTVFDVLEEVSGRKWWITLRLCVSLRHHWEWVGGKLALSGLTPFGVSLAFWLDGAYTAMLDGILERSAKPQKASDWTRALTTPPPQVARKQIDDTENGNAFLAAFNAAR